MEQYLAVLKNKKEGALLFASVTHAESAKKSRGNIRLLQVQPVSFSLQVNHSWRDRP